MQDWRVISEFPRYSVSDFGFVRNDLTDRIMRVSTNQRGIVQVGLVRKHEQYKRSVSVLVADSFIPEVRERFDTPINLDGNRGNNCVTNLLWRPRPFATRYAQQFKIGVASIQRPIYDVDTGEEFATSWDAAIKYGLLDLEILTAMIERTYVFPTFQRFDTIR